jgi:predicted amidophosphoribosyltransferase
VPAGLDACHAAFRYEDTARELVTALKYANQRAVLGRLAAAMAAVVDAAAVDLVTWAPTTGEHRRKRGFDQAELLARSVARRLGRPCRPLLRRAPGPAQTGRSATERRDGPRFTAVVPPGVRVLIVDDVITTGSTLSAAAAALRRAGAGRVVGAAIARTPSPVLRSTLR